jgi:hypothetical protein
VGSGFFHNYARQLANPQDLVNNLTMSDFAKLYGFPKVPSGSFTDQTIAIIELGGGYDLASIATIARQSGLPTPNITDLSVDGATNNYTGDPNSADVEVELDICAAMAYSYSTGTPANLLLVFCPNSQTGYPNGIRAAAAHASSPSIFSSSWGQNEDLSGSSFIQSMDQAFQYGNSKGMTSFVASGDNLDSDGGTGLHCVMPTCLISSPHMKEAQFVAVGDEIYGHDGNLHRVSRIFRRYYNGTLVDISHSKSKGVGIRVTEEHPVLVYRYISKRKPELIASTHKDPEVPSLHYNKKTYSAKWLKAKDIRPGDYLATPKLNLSPTDPSPFPQTDQAAWLIGYYAGNGNIIRDSGRDKGFAISCPPKMLRKVYKAIKSLGLNPLVRKRWTNGLSHGEGHPTSYSVCAYKSDIARHFSDWFGATSSKKKLPSFVFSNGWNLEQVLLGAIESDGTRSQSWSSRPKKFLSGKRLIFNSISRIFAQQIRLIALTLGYRATMHKIPASSEKGWGGYANGKSTWRVCWSKGPSQGFVQFIGNMALIPVRSVEFIPYSGDVYNFEVDDVNSYLADTITTHNCDYPSSSPFVIGCGGTTIVVQNGQITNETPWNASGSGTGGGSSDIESVPAYQNGIPGIKGRGVPDICSPGDPANGYPTPFGPVGGTSGSAPFLASFFAVVNAVREKKSMGRLGLANPIIYQNHAAFFDIVQGNNTEGARFSAGAGWDPASGLGALRGAKLFPLLTGSSGTPTPPPPTPPPPPPSPPTPPTQPPPGTIDWPTVEKQINELLANAAMAYPQYAAYFLLAKRIIDWVIENRPSLGFHAASMRFNGAGLQVIIDMLLDQAATLYPAWAGPIVLSKQAIDWLFSQSPPV